MTWPDSPREECGVFGVFAPGEDVANLTYFGLYALQHRGQESAGIATADGEQVVVYRDLGLVSQVFNEKILRGLEGNLAVGHVRYSTTGSSHVWENAQPAHVSRKDGTDLALGHNGNLVNTSQLAQESGFDLPSSSDSHLIAALVANDEANTIEDAFAAVAPRLSGAYSIVACDDSKIYALRDPAGVRPLVIGRLEGAGHYVVASETCALDIVGASYVRDVTPGELVIIDGDGLRSRQLMEPAPRLCVFEFVYFSRPDSTMYGRSVYEVRRATGKQLADEHPADGDLVIGVPDTGAAAAQGYADRAGIPYGEGLIKNRYVGRTFIQPSQILRRQGVRLKLNPLQEVIEGKRLIVVDDSIVRGTTTRELVQMLRRSGAREIHLRVSSPPIKWPCFYGIDTANKDELIASEKTPEEICEFVGADSLGYLSLDGMLVSTGIATERFCHACFSGGYPIPIPRDTAITKNVLEDV